MKFLDVRRAESEGEEEQIHLRDIGGRHTIAFANIYSPSEVSRKKTIKRVVWGIKQHAVLNSAKNIRLCDDKVKNISNWW